MTDTPSSGAERRHFVLSPTSWLGGCSDRGLKHSTNQDAFCLAVRESAGAAIMAVADGVSTALGAEEASRAATDAACGAMVDAFAAEHDLVDALPSAFRAAHDAVMDPPELDEASACTLVVAAIRHGSVTLGNVGDSRAYWVGDDGSCLLLTTDDSMAQARILLGMPREDAERSHQAHSITKWLGRDADDVRPAITTFEPETGGWLLLCSDGLWNYASSPRDMYDVVAPRTRQSGTAAELAESLVAWAIDRGGRDNITVALARLEP